MFSRQKSSNFASICTYLYFKLRPNKIRYVQFQGNMYIVELLTLFLYKVKFQRLHEQNLITMQNNKTFPIPIETLESKKSLIFIEIKAYLRELCSWTHR